jgi:LysM repeat protein
VDRICPLLALAADRRTAIDGVDAAHRCHAAEPPVPLERQVQSQLCLTPGHERCERYLQHIARSGVARPGQAALADGLLSTRLVLTPEPSWRGIAGRGPRARVGMAVVFGVAALAVGVAGVGLVSTLAGGRLDVAALFGPSATPTPVPTLTPSAEPAETPTAAPSASLSPSPVATSTAAATAAPTPVPTPAPTPPPPVTYVVQAGDTLALIAQQLGTTVEAIQAANGIADANTITVGQVLVIP